MVEQSDRAPLLDWEEIPPPDPNRAGQPPPQPPRVEDTTAEKSSAVTQTRTGTAAGPGWSCTPAAAVVTCSPRRNTAAVAASRGGSPVRQRTELSGRGCDRTQPLGADLNVSFPGLTVRDQWEEKDQIVAVFVVTFDTRSGK